MLSRRKFIGVSSLAVVGTACGAESTMAEDAAGRSSLPIAIRDLQPMKDGVRPISVAERSARIDRARELMAANSLGAIMLAGGTSLEYFTDVRWGNSERMFAMVLPAEGRAFIVCPAFEEGRAREQLDKGPLADTDVLTWHEHESPYALVASGLRDRGLSSGRLGIEETVKFLFSDGIAAAAPTLELTSATPVTAGCRGRKDAHELELMRHASAVTLKAYDAAFRSLQDGMTQDDFSGLISAAHSRLGYPGYASVQVGEYSALPHGSITPQVVREGSIILIDGGCGVEGYRSDISRTFVLGKATDRMKQVFDVEREAQDAALAAARPGVPCEAVDAAARKVIVDAGFGPDYRFFTHRVGHGLGMDGHEWPYLVRGNTLALAPGMTFSDEPGIYIPGEFGIRLEDDMVITEEGAELFTPQSGSLEDPFAVAV
ncbi:MAG TPA: Xaa-Pro peptidase family protein [Longimicrobiaceae bacterium]|nr:Xaa-Pro peptidase family protein [Longimicrobiaceae bacterium]